MQAKGFWSYARGDDDHLDTMLSNLRRVIAGEVSMLMGRDVGIFQDIHDLRTSDRWAEKLRAELSVASFLVPVLTPRFFNRPWCREEVLTYLRLSAEAGLEPRIFPVRFVEWDDDDTCDVREALKPFQYKDLSTWRFESDPTKKSRLVYELAKDIKARLNLAAAPPSGRAPAREPQTSGNAVQIDRSRAEDALPPKHTVHVVDPWPKRGDFTTIQAAIDAAEPGDKIVVREGTYRESLRLSKALEITGEGDRERILVTTDEGDALRCDAPLARISGLRFRREAGGQTCGIGITGGGAEFEDCVVESLSLACIEVAGSGTAPSLRRCLLRDGAQDGLFVYNGAQPLVEDCHFIGHALSGVQVRGQATRATLRRCVAANGKQGGFFFDDGATGVMERCEAIGNAFTGVTIITGAAPVLRDCTLRDNKQSGLFVYENGRGRVEGGRIAGNAKAGVEVRTGGAAEVRGCAITGNGYQAVWIVGADSTGSFTGNDLRGNVEGAWGIADRATVHRSGNKE